jgi:hypothetical protein
MEIQALQMHESAMTTSGSSPCKPRPERAAQIPMDYWVPNIDACKMHTELAGIALERGSNQVCQTVAIDHLEEAIKAIKPPEGKKSYLY